jgi:hypothetical protein
MSKRVVIMSGIPGSGKDTYAHSLPMPSGHKALISADQFFTMSDGYYKFDPSKLEQAHADCFRRFIEQVACPWKDIPPPLIVVCNTNTEAWEIAPYYQASLAFGWEPEIITLRCGTMEEVAKCAQRNIHGCPPAAVYAMHRRLKERRLPPFWKSTVEWVKV